MKFLKFRAWDIQNKVMKEVESIEFFSEDFYEEKYWDVYFEWDETESKTFWWDNPQCILCQFLYNRDKENKMLYEWDIVEFTLEDWKKEIVEITYEYLYIEYSLKNIVKSFKIIWNIFENDDIKRKVLY